jgi:predicted O-methyltransferase YrrM
LELGTSAGFSTLFLAEGVIRTGGKVVTIELDPAKHQLARQHFEQAQVDGFIELIPGDIVTVLQEKHLAGESYDFIFIDADKGQYESYLELSSRLLTHGGTIVADNVMSHSQHLAQFVTSARALRGFNVDVVTIGSGLLRLDHIEERIDGHTERQ